MKLLSGADAFLINGAGMELFMEKVLENYADLPIIEASRGVALLEGAEHHHGHEEEHEEEPSHDEAGHTHSHAENGHVWMDVARYRQQLVTVKEELQKLLPEQKKALEEAALAYDAKLGQLAQEAEALRTETTGLHAVIFHEAFAYLADSLDMEVLMALSLDEETVPSAGEIAEVIEEINYHGYAVIFIEESYAEYADKILAETAAEVVYLNPLTTGDGAADSYILEMQKNLEAIRGVIR